MHSIKWLWVTPNHSNFYILHYLVVATCIDFKFDVQVDHDKSQPTDNKPSLKGAWSHHVTHLNFQSSEIIWDDLSYILQILYTGWPCKVLAFRLTNSPSTGCGQWSRSRDLFKFWDIIDNISEMVQDRYIVTVEDEQEQEIMYGQLNGMIAVDLE